MSQEGASAANAALARRIAELKTGGGAGFPRELVIRGKAVGAMRSVGFADLRDDGLITQLKQWRNQHSSSFFTQFEATAEGTRRWLADILDSADRVLFLVCDVSGEAVGQCGARNITPDTAACDAILRGEERGHPFLMTLAERALMEWLFDALGVRHLHTQVFADNFAAIRLFRSLGMTVTRMDWFKRTAEGKGTRYMPAGGETSSDCRKVAWLEMASPSRQVGS
jgi:RimJ/RimL family protein N-acetyltransferase